MRYQVDMDAALTALGPRVIEQVGDAISVDPDLWLYRPPRVRRDAFAELTFALPPGGQVSAPWPRPTSGEAPVFRLASTVFRRRGRVVVGRFAHTRVMGEGVTLQVALPGERALPAPRAAAWLSQALHTVTSSLGAFPTSHVQVIVQPAPGRGVYFGQVLRAGGASLQVWVGTESQPDDLHGDWVAVHELSHLYLPFVRSDERWLSEGIATYYQHVLRARMGTLAEEEVWRALIDGHRVGRSGPGRASLAEAARTMAQDGEYRRVYWGGATLVWLADVLARAHSDNAHSLDAGVTAWRQCCAEPDVPWSAQDLCGAIDRELGAPLFGAVIPRYLEGTAWPELAPLLAKLGIEERRGRIVLRDDAPWSHVRRAIVGPTRLSLPPLGP